MAMKRKANYKKRVVNAVVGGAAISGMNKRDRVAVAGLSALSKHRKMSSISHNTPGGKPLSPAQRAQRKKAAQAPRRRRGR